MQTYRNATVITALLTLLSLIGAIAFNSMLCIDPFWSNLLLGVFGSGLLTFITSVVGYRVERKKTFEGFSYATKQILKCVNKYQSSWLLEEKIDFFLMLHDMNWSDWDRYFGDFCFLFDFGHKNRTYIFQKIYHPLQEIDYKINYHTWHFRWYKDGSGRNAKVVEKFVQEIEDLIIETKDIQVNEGEKLSETTTGFPIVETRNKVAMEILEELNGEYYRLMSGKSLSND